MNYIISSSATADLPTSYYKEKDCRLLPFPYYIDDVMYDDNYFEKYGVEEFYEYAPIAKSVKTSQPALGVIEEYFEGLLKEGKDVLHIELTSGLSGTYQSAKMIAEELNTKYPNKVIVIDSACVTGSQGMLLNRMAENRDKGLTIEENAKDLDEYKMTINCRFYTTDIRMFVKGGRVKPAVGKICEVANIVPCMYVTSEGKLEMLRKCLGKKKALMESIKDMEALARGGREYDGPVVINHSVFQDEVDECINLINKRFPKVKDIRVYNIGPVIGSHTGPYTLAVFFEGKKRED